MTEKFNWIKFSLINFSLVALLGLLMRYKIAFEFPFFDQKNIQHAHSHFAFYGWLTHTIMTLMVYFLYKNHVITDKKKYNLLILLNLICSYGMLFAFSIDGYNPVSIFFSVSAVFISYIFTIFFIKDIRRIRPAATFNYWFIAALIFNIVSSLGTFALAYLMASKHLSQQQYLASVYFYLHFQYNGWFFFASMGLLHLFIKNSIADFKYNKTIFWMFCLSAGPAYFLSVLWLNLPVWLYIIVVVASVVQVIAWILFLRSCYNSFYEIKSSVPKLLYAIFLLVAAALTVKFLLQLGSVVPFISKLAFGFRPIVIAYLHLVLLAVLSIFLLAFLFTNHFLTLNKTSKSGLVLLVSGVYTTEIILGIQGVASFSYIMVPYVNEALFAVALVIFTGLLLLVFSGKK